MTFGQGMDAGVVNWTWTRCRSWRLEVEWVSEMGLHVVDGGWAEIGYKGLLFKWEVGG